MGAIALLEVDQWADEHDLRTVRASRLDYRPASLVADVTRASDCHLGVEIGHRF